MHQAKPTPERITAVQSIKRIGADLKVRCKVECANVSGYFDYEDMLWQDFREVDGAQHEVESIRKGLYEDLENLWKELTMGEEILFERNEVALRNQIVLPTWFRSAALSVNGTRKYKLKVDIMQWQRGVYPEREVVEHIERVITLTEFMQMEFERTESYNKIVEAIAKEVQKLVNNGWHPQNFGWVAGCFPSRFAGIGN